MLSAVGNNMSNNVNFGAKFRKNPVPVIAEKMKNEFEVANPWGEGMLKGNKGDYKVTNLFSNETYPCKPDSFDYQHVKGNRYITREDKPVYVDAKFPEGAMVESHEGAEKTLRADGMPGIIVQKTQDSKPYVNPADYFLKAYSPADEEAESMVTQLKKIVPADAYKVD